MGDTFTFTSVTRVTPKGGSIEGLTPVTITGVGFTFATGGVTFGGTAATNVSIDSDTSIRATVPAHAAGTVDVVVAGVGTGTALYTYQNPATTLLPRVPVETNERGEMQLDPKGAVKWLMVAKQRIETIQPVDSGSIIGPLNPDQIPQLPFSRLTMDSPRLLGRTTAGTGDSEEIRVAAGLTLSGGILSLAGLPGGYAIGDLLYADSDHSLARLADVSVGSYLRSGGVVTAPLWSTLKLPNAANSGDILRASGANVYASVAPEALTKVNDTNVTLTLGGTPASALVNATSLTLGWTGTLAVSRGGTGTGTAFTAGSVIFAGASGVYSQDNANLFWDDTNNRLGVGQTAPDSTLTINGTFGLRTGNSQLFTTYPGGSLRWRIQDSTGTETTNISSSGLSYFSDTLALGVNTNYSSITTPLLYVGADSQNAIAVIDGAAQPGQLYLSRSGGTMAARTNIGNGQSTGTISSYAYSGGSFFANAFLNFAVDGTFTSGQAPPGRIVFSTNIANASPTEKVRINSVGGVGIGVTSITAMLHLKAGTTAASTAPLKFTSGSLLTTAEAGAVEFLTDAYYGTITTGAARKTFAFLESPAFTTPDIGAATGASLALTSSIGKYKNVNTAGWGVPAIYAHARSTAQVAAVASVATYTVGAADGTFKVSANVNVTTSTTHNFTAAVDYTDETNTARTATLSFELLAGGAPVTAIDNANGAVPYNGLALHIRCKASTAITIKTVGTFTTVTYNVGGLIEQLA